MNKLLQKMIIRETYTNNYNQQRAFEQQQYFLFKMSTRYQDIMIVVPIIISTQIQIM